jgi:hypothetical protein
VIAVSLESRVAALEAEMARLKRRLEAASSSEPQWKKIVGVFANDLAFSEAMRLRREYRESAPRRTRRGNVGTVVLGTGLPPSREDEE